jgi:hypothetical protein
VRRAIKVKALSRVYLAMYMLYSEWLVTEQNSMYYAVQGKTGFKTMPAVDFTGRVITKGFLRIFAVVFGKRATRLAMKVNLNDERVNSHQDG